MQKEFRTNCCNGLCCRDLGGKKCRTPFFSANFITFVYRVKVLRSMYLLSSLLLRSSPSHSILLFRWTKFIVVNLGNTSKATNLANHEWQVSSVFYFAISYSDPDITDKIVMEHFLLCIVINISYTLCPLDIGRTVPSRLLLVFHLERISFFQLIL